MEVYFPGYYHSFQCIAGACPDSCCKEWAVDVDAEAAKYYRELPGQLGDELRAVLQDSDDGTIMTIQNGRCPMWQQDGLCKIQAQLGHEALCKTCREFPRLRHDYGNFVELGLELSCPEAARLILTSDAHKLFVQAQPGGEEPEYDEEAMAILQASRREVLAFLENRDYSLPETLAIILLHSHSVQAQLDGAEAMPCAPEECLAEAKEYAATGDIGAIIAFYADLAGYSVVRSPARFGAIWHSALLATSCFRLRLSLPGKVSHFCLPFGRRARWRSHQNRANVLQRNRKQPR